MRTNKVNKPHRVTSDRTDAIEFVIRPTEEGSGQDGSIFWSLEYCEGDPEELDDEDIYWQGGLPWMTGKQLAAFAMWLVSADPPGIASPHHPGRCDVR